MLKYLFSLTIYRFNIFPGNFHFANGDINKLETGGGLFSTVATAAESPLQATSAEFAATPGTLTTSPTVPAADQSSNSGSAAASSGTIIGTTGIAATSNPIIYSTTETVALQGSVLSFNTFKIPDLPLLCCKEENWV